MRDIMLCNSIGSKGLRIDRTAIDSQGRESWVSFGSDKHLTGKGVIAPIQEMKMQHIIGLWHAHNDLRDKDL